MQRFSGMQTLLNDAHPFLVIRHVAKRAPFMLDI
jgi:hypothetical protein